MSAEQTTIDALRSGDERAFAALVRKHHPELLRYAKARARTHALAEEAVQETWVVFLSSLAKFEGRSKLRTFLFGILLNTLRSRGRVEARNVPLSSFEDPLQDRFVADGEPWAGHWAEPPAPWPAADDALCASRLRDAIATAIDELPEPQREVITLRDVLGWESNEIAELTGASEGHVRVILHRARTRVRAVLEKRFAVKP
jgi:RNA polymerase sigma-70 factor, ECF subfamily